MKEINKINSNAFITGIGRNVLHVRVNNQIVKFQINDKKLITSINGKVIQNPGNLHCGGTITELIALIRNGQLELKGGNLSYSQLGGNKLPCKGMYTFGTDCSSENTCNDSGCDGGYSCSDGSGCDGGYSCSDGSGCGCEGGVCGGNECSGNECGGNATACGGNACGMNSCGGDAVGCGGNACGGDACGGNLGACGGNACGADECGGNLGACGGNACAGEICGGNATGCGAEGCIGNLCGGDFGGCAVDGCGAEACGINITWGAGACPVDMCPIDYCVTDVIKPIQDNAKVVKKIKRVNNKGNLAGKKINRQLNLHRNK